MKSLPISVGTRPDHGFDEPLGLLSDCDLEAVGREMAARRGVPYEAPEVLRRK
jgi:hypothetical protein